MSDQDALMGKKEFPRIRKFRREDIHQILEIEKQAFPKTAYPKAFLLNYAKSIPDGFVVLEKGEDIVGYIIFDTEGHVHSAAVKTAHRRKGFGRMLFAYASQHAKERLWLEVRSKNDAAIRFYKTMGMKIIGRISGYYRSDDALVMVLNEKAQLGVLKT